MFTSYGQLVMNAIQQRHAQIFTTLSQLQLLFSNPQSTDVSFSASKLSMHKCLSPSECCLPPSARMLFSILLSHRCVHLPGQYSKLLRQNVQCLRQLKMLLSVAIQYLYVQHSLVQLKQKILYVYIVPENAKSPSLMCEVITSQLHSLLHYICFYSKRMLYTIWLL